MLLLVFHLTRDFAAAKMRVAERQVLLAEKEFEDARRSNKASRGSKKGTSASFLPAIKGASGSAKKYEMTNRRVSRWSREPELYQYEKTLPEWQSSRWKLPVF